jgi:serine/threonine protein kinase
MPDDFTHPAGLARCPTCGTPLPEQALQGLCPKCLFAGLAAPTGDGAGEAARAPPQKPEILECLGRGGRGVVYKARQISRNRFVALKLLAPERVKDAKFAQRFTHEAQSLAALNHPNIVTIYDFGQAGGFYFLLMEFVDGVNLRQAMKAGCFTPEQALAVVPPVCEALQYARDHGVLHRDIKPENLLLDKAGRVKIADFGIAKMMLGGEAAPLWPVDPQTKLAPRGQPIPHPPPGLQHRTIIRKRLSPHSPSMQLVWPSVEYLSSYVTALERGWSSDETRGEIAAREELSKISADPVAFIRSLADREGKGATVNLPDGSVVPRLPGYRRWMWDGEFCGDIGFRWQPGTAALPPTCLGHIGYGVVP